MSRSPIPTWYFALVIVRRGQRFLLTQERKYGSRWSIPGGRVEPGESLITAAVREVHEETGVPVRIDGILRVEHATAESSVRMRVLFTGTPIDDTPPKTEADDESLRAAWLTLDEIRALPLRGAELHALLESVQSGRQVFPLTLLGDFELSVTLYSTKRGARKSPKLKLLEEKNRPLDAAEGEREGSGLDPPASDPFGPEKKLLFLFNPFPPHR